MRGVERRGHRERNTDDCRSMSRLMSITISIMNIIIIDYHNEKGAEIEIKVKGEKIEKDEYQ